MMFYPFHLGNDRCYTRWNPCHQSQSAQPYTECRDLKRSVPSALTLALAGRYCNFRLRPSRWQCCRYSRDIPCSPPPSLLQLDHRTFPLGKVHTAYHVLIFGSSPSDTSQMCNSPHLGNWTFPWDTARTWQSLLGSRTPLRTVFHTRSDQCCCCNDQRYTSYR